MCGIIGVFNDESAVQKAAIALDILKNRGGDGAGICDGKRIFIKKTLEELKNAVSRTKSDVALGHVLHSLVNFVPQPIKGKGILVSNCEIYNWKELDVKYGLGCKNDSELILKLIEKKGAAKLREVMDELDGVYAFAYMADDSVYAARDILGVKPLWYAKKNGFAFASEKKALLKIGFASEEIEELNPRTVLCYNLMKKEITELKRDFFTTLPRNEKTLSVIKQELKGLLLSAIAKRVPDGRFGILFSGGIDSTVIATVCKQLGVPFTCYTAALESDDEAEDVTYAKKVAADLGFDLKIKTIKLSEVEEKLKIVVPLIEDSNVVKVGVGLTFHVACEEAKKDGIKVIFSGLGSEELFAGYERHKQSTDANKECLSGLLKIYERDTYRDDVITMFHNMELRLPFLDRKLADFSLKIPAKYKLDEKQNKIILRQVAEEMGIPCEFAQRKKRAAQYGSRFDKALDKLARKNGFKFKSQYLARFENSNPRLGILWSSGKDSCYAMHIMKRQNYPIACLISIKSTNPDSYMFHTPNIHLAELQADALALPIVVQETTGKKEAELKDLEKAIITAKDRYRIEGIATGALFSNYQRERIERICDRLGLKIFSPLWHIDQEKEMRQILDEGFEIILSSIAAEGLDKSWLGRRITANDIDRLVMLNKKYGLNVAGEGGEFESLVLDAPMFQKKIEIKDFSLISDSENSARMDVKKAILKEKQTKK